MTAPPFDTSRWTGAPSRGRRAAGAIGAILMLGFVLATMGLWLGAGTREWRETTISVGGVLVRTREMLGPFETHDELRAIDGVRIYDLVVPEGMQEPQPPSALPAVTVLRHGTLTVHSRASLPRGGTTHERAERLLASGMWHPSPGPRPEGFRAVTEWAPQSPSGDTYFIAQDGTSFAAELFVVACAPGKTLSFEGQSLGRLCRVSARLAAGGVARYAFHDGVWPTGSWRNLAAILDATLDAHVVVPSAPGSMAIDTASPEA